MKTKRIPVTKEHRLAAAALAILDEEGPKFRMRDLINDETSECGTTCCIAGHAVLLDPAGASSTPTEISRRRKRRLEDLGAKFYSSFDDEHRTSHYIFHHWWPDNRRQSAARCLYVLENGQADPACPMIGTRPRVAEYKIDVPRNIRARLRKHLHPEHPLFKP